MSPELTPNQISPDHLKKLATIPFTPSRIGRYIKAEEKRQEEIYKKIGGTERLAMGQRRKLARSIHERLNGKAEDTGDTSGPIEYHQSIADAVAQRITREIVYDSQRLEQGSMSENERKTLIENVAKVTAKEAAKPRNILTQSGREHVQDLIASTGFPQHDASRIRKELAISAISTTASFVLSTIGGNAARIYGLTHSSGLSLEDPTILAAATLAFGSTLYMIAKMPEIQWRRIKEQKSCTDVISHAASIFFERFHTHINEKGEVVIDQERQKQMVKKIVYGPQLVNQAAGLAAGIAAPGVLIWGNLYQAAHKGIELLFLNGLARKDDDKSFLPTPNEIALGVKKDFRTINSNLDSLAGKARKFRPLSWIADKL